MNEVVMSIANRRPWDGSGVSVEGETDSKSVMKKAGLDWEVEGRPVYVPTSSRDNMTNFAEFSKYKAVVRKTDDGIMGMVGKGWNILQNHEVFEFIDELVALGLVKYGSAGSFKDGKIVYVTADFRESEIVPGDLHKTSFMFTNSFTTQFSIGGGWSDIRFSCWNTFILSNKDSRKSGFSIRHTAAMREKLEVAKKALFFAETEARQAEMFQKALSRLTMRGDMWRTFSEAVIPIPDEGKNTTRSDHSRERLLELAFCGAGQEITGVQGTAYAALNGLTEYVTYDRSSMGKTEDEKQSNRFQTTMFGSGTGNKLINRGVDALSGLLRDNGIQVDTA